MVVLFLLDDRGNRGHGQRVDVTQCVELMGEVPEDHTLDRNRGGNNRFAAAQAGDQPQYQAAETA